MKKYSLKELQEMAKAHFDALAVNKLYATSDGQFFLNAGRANLHAGASLTVYPIEKEESAQEADVQKDHSSSDQKPISIAELKKQLPAMNMSELESALMSETAGANRKGATEAIEAQIAILLKDGREKE